MSPQERYWLMPMRPLIVCGRPHSRPAPGDSVTLAPRLRALCASVARKENSVSSVPLWLIVSVPLWQIRS